MLVLNVNHVWTLSLSILAASSAPFFSSPLSKQFASLFEKSRARAPLNLCEQHSKELSFCRFIEERKTNSCVARCCHFVSPCSTVLWSWFFFQSLGIQVVLTILLITCTVSFTIRLVDLYKVYSDFSFTKTLGSTVALLFASTVSEFKFFLSLWSGNSCNSIIWHVRLVFYALSLSTGWT